VQQTTRSFRQKESLINKKAAAQQKLADMKETLSNKFGNNE
jgi:hypothetical protein